MQHKTGVRKKLVEIKFIIMMEARWHYPLVGLVRDKNEFGWQKGRKCLWDIVYTSCIHTEKM